LLKLDLGLPEGPLGGKAVRDFVVGLQAFGFGVREATSRLAALASSVLVAQRNKQANHLYKKTRLVEGRKQQNSG